jgi:hypothetical protein
LKVPHVELVPLELVVSLELELPLESLQSLEPELPQEVGWHLKMPMELKQLVEMELPEQHAEKLPSADKGLWRWQEPALPKLEPPLMEVYTELKLPMEQEQPQKMGEQGNSLYVSHVPRLGTEAAKSIKDSSRNLYKISAADLYISK